MKHIYFSILFLGTIVTPSRAQWIHDAGNIQVIAFGVHDTSLFFSEDHRLDGPNGEADNGIDFNTFGNVISFASFGQYFFANSTNNGFQYSFRTSDNGSNWRPMVAVAGIASNNHYLFGTYSNRSIGPYIALSRDIGQTWDSVAKFNGGNYNNTFAIDSTCIYAISGSTLWRSLDTGARGTWTRLDPPFVGTMLTMGTLLFIYQPYDPNAPSNATNDNGVLILSRDSGMTWDTVHVDSAGTQEWISALATDGKNLFVGGYKQRNDYSGNGVYVSTDTGRTWRAENDGLGNYYVTALGVYDTLLYAAAGAGFPYVVDYRPIREMVDTTPSAVVQTLPTDTIELYPNPTLDRVALRSGGTSILGVRVLNVLGTEVQRIPQLRESNISIDFSKLPSGTYFLEIETANGMILRKVICE